MRQDYNVNNCVYAIIARRGWSKVLYGLSAWVRDGRPMITVEVNVPTLEKTYQCSLDEDAKIYDIMEDIVDLICQKEGIVFREDMRELIFCSLDKKIIFNRRATLADYSISFGETLGLL